MKTQKVVHHPSPAPSPAHRRPPVQHDMDVPRAYRLGKCETLCDLHFLLVDEHYSARDLQQEIVFRMCDLSTRDAAALLGHKHLPQLQECQGMADACIYCFDLIAVQKLHPYALSHALADCMFAAWPPDYLEYRQRCEKFADQDPLRSDTIAYLELREWYAAVDALDVEIACAELSGLPSSEEQLALETVLLVPARDYAVCAPVPCAD